MKRKLHLLGLIPALLFASGCGKNGDDNMKNVNVIILSGQSNAVGCKAYSYLEKTMGKAKYKEYLAGYEDIKVSYNCWTVDCLSPTRPKYLQNQSKRGEFVKTTVGYGNSTENFGPEVGMAEKLHKKWGKRLYIIKFACGASNLNDDWAQYDEELFVKMIKYIDDRFDDLKAEGLNPKLRAFCWMQGEGDAYPGYSSYYYENLVNFKSNLDKNLLKYTENKNLPFIDAGIGKGEHADHTIEWKNYQEVNDCKRDFAALSKTNIYFDTIEAGLHSNQEPSDDVHYDSESQIKLGHLFAEHFEKFLK